VHSRDARRRHAPPATSRHAATCRPPRTAPPRTARSEPLPRDGHRASAHERACFPGGRRVWLQFHRWQFNSIDVVLIGRVVCAAIFGLSCLVVLWVLGSMVYAVFFEDRLPVELKSTAQPGCEREPHASQSNSESVVNLQEALKVAGAAKLAGRREAEGQLTCNSRRCTSLIDYVSVMPTIVLLGALFWMIFAPIFYWDVFQPCWECYDFEATIAHEIGHVLGFHHPDTEARATHGRLDAPRARGHAVLDAAADAADAAPRE
jgi:hypothetical protein